MFMMIENKGVCPLEGYKILGLSTRGAEDIGQFGSGNKYALTCLMRHGLTPILMRGLEKHTFEQQESEFRGKKYTKILMDGAELGFSLDHGRIDWTSPLMAYREYVSNALDEGEAACRPATQVEGREGYTRIFIPLDSSGYQFLAEYHKRFIQAPYGVLEKEGRELSGLGCMVYRRGVFVTQLDGVGLYDYNFQHLNIDECRNGHINEIHGAMAKALLDRGYSRIIDNINDNNIYEIRQLPIYLMNLEGDWMDAWPRGTKYVCDPKDLEVAKKKNQKVVLVREQVWGTVLKRMSIPKFETDNNERANRSFKIADKEVVDRFNEIWEKLRVPGGKPAVTMFSQPGDAGLKGYYLLGVIYIRDTVGGKELDYTIVEEIAHHISGGGDYSYELQNFLISKIAELL